MSERSDGPSVGARLSAWLAAEEHRLRMASAGCSCGEVRALAFGRLDEAIARNGAASTAMGHILDELESKHRHEGVVAPS